MDVPGGHHAVRRRNNILVLFADGTGAQDADGTLHLGFRLGRTGETLTLTDRSGQYRGQPELSGPAV